MKAMLCLGLMFMFVLTACATGAVKCSGPLSPINLPRAKLALDPVPAPKQALSPAQSGSVR